MTNLSKQRELFDWLHSLDLSHHFDHFVENGYDDLDICREIGESDLQAIGVCDIHERIALLQAIRHSRQVYPTSSSSSMAQRNSSSRDRDNYISTNYNYQECVEEPFYESVLPFEPNGCSSHDYEIMPECIGSTTTTTTTGASPGGRNSRSGRIIWPNSASTASRPTHLLQHQHQQHNSNSLHANLIPRTQLRDQLREDGINISHIPDEVTLGAFATQYASELHGSENASEFLTFQQEIHHQLREIWFEERRKLVSQQQQQPDGFSSFNVLGSESPVRRLFPVTRGTFTNNSCSRNTTTTRKANVPSGSSTFGKKHHHPVPVPTVSGIVSSSSGGGGGGNPPISGAERLVDAMTAGTSAAAAAALRSPEHRPQHQYLQHIIISNENQHGSNNLLSTYSHPLAPHLHTNGMHEEENRPIYTPGIYLPSSCLLDKDEIYDYAPPLQHKNHPSPSKRSLSSPFKSKAKSKSSLSCYHGAGAQASPSRRHYATIRNSSNGGISSCSSKSMSRSVSLQANHVSPTYVNTSALMTADLANSYSPSSQGCRTLTNLSRLSRRLGLSRFFRTFRSSNSGTASQNSKLMTMSTTTTSASTKASGSNRQLVPSNPGKIRGDEDDGTIPSTLSSLPSNERIIETINRLKYEELQKRKERIAQEHQMILKELKNSMSPSTNSSDGPSSIFYVSNSNSNGGTEDEEIGVVSVSASASTTSQHTNQQLSQNSQHQQQHSTTSYYEDPPYENQPGSQIEQFQHKPAVMGSKQSKRENGKERRSWTGSAGIEYGEPGTYREPSSNRTSSSSNYHSNSMSESISSSGEVNGLGLEPELSISSNLDGRKSARRGNSRGTENPPPCEILSSSNGGDSSTGSSRGSQTEHFPLQHLSEQNQQEQESENSFPQSSKSLFGKVKELGSKGRRRFSSHKTSSFGNHLNTTNSTSSIPGSNEQPPQQQSSSLNSNNFEGGNRKSMGGEGNGENGSNETRTGCTSSYRSKAVDIIGPGGRNSSEEELISITNSQSGGFGSLSLSETEEYTGPFVGKAVALVDCMHSPYDRHALRYKKGDLIEIISKKPSGLWTGKVNGQVGHFKFINVEILPDPESDEDEGEDESGGSNVYDRSGDHRSRQAHSYLHIRRRNKRMTAMTPWEMEQRQTVANVVREIRKENAALSQHSKSLDSESPFRGVHGRTGRRKSSATTTATATAATAASLKKGRPKSVGDLLRRINLEEYISVFILHGFESLDLFKELEEEDLDRLAIHNQSDRTKILTVVELLREFDSEAEIPPIIIPTYSCPSQLDGIDDREDCDLEEESDLHRIIAPPANFTRTGGAGSKSNGTTMVRDSGVFVKCDDQEDPEIEEIILSPVNLRVDMSPGPGRGGGSRSSAPPSVFLGRLTNSNSGHGKQFQVHSHPLSQIKNQMDAQESVKSNDSWPENVEQYCAVRQRFLQAKSMFETGATSPSGTPQSSSSGDQGQKNRFLFCEKSSDSGISVGANSPPPPTRID